MPDSRVTLASLAAISSFAFHQATASAQTLSIGQMFSRMQNKNVTGITVVTHGYQFLDNGGDSLMPLAQAIRDKIASQAENAWLVDYDVPDDQVLGRFDLSVPNPPPTAAASGHVVLLWDWAPESNRTSGRFADSAGDALFAFMNGLHAVDPRKPGNTANIHMIAHSFGSGVTSEAVERMARYKVDVPNVTYIDPHDFDQANVPVDENQQIFTMGKPQGYGATVWNNVDFADVYYQTRGNQGGAVALGTDNPEGRPIAGAYKRHLATELPSDNPYGTFSTDSDHSYAWDTFYRATVDGSRRAGSIAPQTEPDYSQTGWAYSVENANRINTNNAPRNFYGAGQDHEHSETVIVDRSTGQPNNGGLAGLGLTAQQITDGRFAPDWNINEIANGNLAGGGADELISGWSHHGGGGNGFVTSETVGTDTNYFLRMNFANDVRKHNFVYVPVNAKGLKFEKRVSIQSSDDQMSARIGDADFGAGTTQIGTIDVTATHAWQNETFAVPKAYRGMVTTFDFSIVSPGFLTKVDSEVDLDSFEWDMLNPLLEATPTSGMTINLGNVLPGQPKTIADAVNLKNIGDLESIIDVNRIFITRFGSEGYFESPDFDYAALEAGGTDNVLYDVRFLGAMMPGMYTGLLKFDTTYGFAEYTLTANVIPEPTIGLIVAVAITALGTRSRRQFPRKFGPQP